MNQSIQRLMTSKILSVNENTSASEAEQMMNEKHIHHLPVLNLEGEITGILLKQDLRFTKAFPLIRVDQVMTTHYVSLNKDTPISTAALKMIEKDASCALVMDDGKEPIGILTHSDLLFDLARRAESDLKAVKAPIKMSWPELPTVGALIQKIADMGI